MGKQTSKTDPLRTAAEAVLAGSAPSPGSLHSAHQLLHELQVHKIELEMQNESLSAALVALEESRDRYADLYEFAPVAYLTLTPAGLIEQVNLTGAALLGIERQQLLQRHFVHFIAPADRDRWRRHFMEQMQQQEGLHAEMSLLREDGAPLQVKLNSQRIIAEGRSPAVRMVLTDVTRQRQAEESLQAWGDFAKHATWGMSRIDRESRRISLCNAAYAQMHGYSAGELLGFRAESLYPPEYRARLTENIKRLDRDGHVTYESLRLRKDGSVFPAIVNLSLAVNANRPCVIANVRDISARKQAEDDFQLFFNLLPELACITTRDARLVKVNPAWQRILGYSPQELISRSLLDFIHADDQGVTRRLIQNQRDGEQTQGLVNRARCKEGGYRLLEWASSLSADSSLFVATARDITDRRLVEETIKESRDFAVSIMDSLNERIAVLDERGVVTAVNQQWTRFAAENGAPDVERAVGVGSNYFAVCNLPPNDPDSASATAAKAGIQSVFSGTMESFCMEYPCHSPSQRRWFEMRVGRLPSLRPSVVVAHKDITARIRSDEALRLRDAALEASATAMLTTDRHGVITWANNAFCVLTGYANEEVLGRTPGALLNSGKHDLAVYQDIWRTILAGQVWRGELINRRRDGSLYHEQQTITPVRDEHGAISQFLSAKQDISNRKRLEADLRDSEERYRMIFEMSEEAIFAICPDDASTLAVNPAACKMFGYGETELSALGRTGIMDTTDPAWAVLLAERSRVGHAHGQVRCVRRNGEIFPAEMTAVVFRDANGQARGVVHIRDTSEQTRAEKVLRESEMRWQFAVESHGDAMWDWDADKDELFLTAAAQELFELPDTGSKQTIADLLAQVIDEDRASMEVDVADIVANKTSEWAGEYRLSGHDGPPRWIATRGRVMTRVADGRAHRVVSVSSDITQKKAKQDEARRQRELVTQQARLVLLGELASALAHEINQPLTAITGYASACARKVAEVPGALNLVRAIEAQAMRAGEIAWRMRGFARRQSLGRSALSLKEVVAGVAKWVRMDSALSDAVIDISGIADDLPMVLADRVEVEQVLLNLVRNGIEASLPKIGEASITIAAHAAKDSGEIEISVTDAGCGLPASLDFDAFKPFTSTKADGLGLGLTISCSIIEGHGGHLWATPNPAGGTIFHFTLPIARENVAIETIGTSLQQGPGTPLHR